MELTQEPRTVIFVESDAAMGGVQFSTVYLVQHLNRAYWRPVVICPQEGDLPKACRRAGVPVHILPRPKLHSTSIQLGKNRRLPNPLAWIWDVGVMGVATLRLSHFLRQQRPDLIVTKGLFSHFYGGLAARWLNLPCIWHVQDFISERFWGLYRRVFGQLAYWLPGHIIVDGKPISGQLPQTVQGHVTILHNGVDTTLFRPGLDGTLVRQELDISSEALVIGHVARMTPWKGQHYLLEAFAQIAPKFPLTYLLFVGAPVFDTDTYERHLRDQVLNLGLADRVIFAGYRYDLPQVLAAMDIFAYPSIEKDTSPLALLSAMAAGLPIIAFDIEGIHEVLEDQMTGLLIPPGETKDFALALERLLQDPGRRQELAQQTRIQAVENFNLETYVRQFEMILTEALQE